MTSDSDRQRPPSAGKGRIEGSGAGRSRIEDGQADRRAAWTGGQADRGAASILVLAIGLVLVAAGLAGAFVANARVARHQARVAADFGALAGALRVAEGQDSACAAAARLVEANGGVLVSCQVQGLEVVVRVTVTMGRLPRPAHAAARAGPLSARAS